MVTCGVSFGVCRTRITKLDGLGNVVNEAGNSYVSDKVVSVGMTANIETGDTFTRRNGCGCAISRFKVNDVFNWFEFAFEDGALEPEMQSMMLGLETITNGADIVGAAFGGALACDEDPPAVAFEFWTQYLDENGALDEFYPYVHWVFPYTLWQLGDNTAEQDFMANALSGFSRANNRWGQGPYADGPPDGQDIRNGGYWLTDDALPDAACVSAEVEPGS